MKFSYNWLKEYVDIKKTPEELAEILTMRAFEAEGVEKLGKKFNNIVIGEVLGVKKHPNADRLSLVTVDIKKGVLEIVCGASNVKRGQKVAVALSGAKLPNGMEIIEREVRGVKSAGMICAEDELGISASHEGIMVLAPDAPAGMPLSGFLNLEDSIIDFSILPDRAHDALSYWGMSQEIAAITGRKLKKGIYEKSKFNFSENKKSNIKREVAVEIKEKDLCRRYSARVVKNVSVSDSPDWIRQKLESAGIRSVNNIVDISNLAMLETGQPLHIFDLDKISYQGVHLEVELPSALGSSTSKSVKKIIVRKAKKDETILALDGKEYKLNESVLVVADKKKALAIAGIMGGEFSGVSSATKNIVIEAANFEPANIRVSSKNLGIASDSSYRFEREFDRNLTVLALNRATELISQIAGSEVAKGIVDVYPVKTRPRKINLEISAVEKLLGAKIADKKIVKILLNLGLGVKKGRKNSLEIIVPARRLDITDYCEVIREIARVYGYDNIKPVKPKVALELPRANFNVIYQNRTKKFLAANGFTEVYNYSFIGDREINNIGANAEHYLELANPLSAEHKYLRLSLVPLLLNNIAANAKIFTGNQIKIFEIGKVYYHDYMGNNNCFLEEAAESSQAGAAEKNMLAGAMYDSESSNLFYKAKYEAELLLGLLKITDISIVSHSEQCPHLPVWHLGRYALIGSGHSIIGVAGEINPKVLEKYKIPGRVGIFNLDFQKIIGLARSKKDIYQPIVKFPPVKIDLAFLIPKKILWSQIKDLVYEAGEGLVKNVELFDVYEGKNIPTEKKSIAFHAVFQASDKTLKDEDIKNITNKIIGELKNKLGANIRN